MALLHTESFDWCTSLTALGTRYDSISISGLGSSYGRTNNGLFIQSYTRYLTTRALPASGTTCIIGVALKITDLVGRGGQPGLFSIIEGTTAHLTLVIDSTGHLVLKRGDYTGTTLGTSSVILSMNVFLYLELKAVIHDTTGSYTVRVNGTTFGGLTGSSMDTRNGGSGTWDHVTLGGSLENGYQYYDDWYICDGSGSVNNDFLGDIQIRCILPQTDAVGGIGSSAQFALSTGSDQGALVDEAEPNGDTDYVYDTTAGHAVTFNYPAVGINGTVKGLTVLPYLKKTDAGARQVTTVARVSGTTYDAGSSISPETNYVCQPQIWERSPATNSAWTVSEIDSAEFGLKITDPIGVPLLASATTLYTPTVS